MLIGGYRQTKIVRTDLRVRGEFDHASHIPQLRSCNCIMLGVIKTHCNITTYIPPLAEEDNKTRKLTDKDLPSLLCQLKKHAAKWREIGIHLGFLPGELANIGGRPNISEGAPVSWFAAMLEDWLQWAPGDCRGSISFATLKGLQKAFSEAGLGASAHDLSLKVVL